MRPLIRAAVLLVGLGGFAAAAEPRYDLLIRGGRVIDPKSGTDAVRDVAVAQGKIAQVAASIPAAEAKQVIDATGLLVTPGLVDLHVHVFHGTEDDAYLSNSFGALPPDGFVLRTCTTTIADTGGAGWRNLPQFKAQVVDRAQPRVLSWLNIVGAGMKGGAVEQNVADMDPVLAARRIRDFKDLVVGVKVAHFEGQWEAVDRAVEAGRLANIPVMVDFGEHNPELSMEDLLLNRLRPEDVLTHTYAHVRGRTPLVDPNGKLRPFVSKARERGVFFDVGHGGGSFRFSQAVPALKQGFLPDSISTDLHTGSMNSGMKDLTNLMSKFLALGLTVPDVVVRTTWNPARIMKRTDFGHLDVGVEADIAVLNLRQGRFGYVDVDGQKKTGTQKLECELTVRAGKIVWDLNGISKPEFK